MQIVDYFLDSLKSKHTKEQYDFHRQRFKKYNDSVHFNAATKDPELLTQNIINYLSKMKTDGLSYSFRNTALSSVKHDLTMKDIMLNWKKISKFLGEKSLDNEIRAYTHEEIRRMLDVADVKYRAVILLYASSGMRRAALTDLHIKDFEYLPNHQIYKINIYRKTQSQQVCFTTPEAATAIGLYLRDKSPNDYFHHIAPKSVSEQMRSILIEAGIGERHTELKDGEAIGQYRDAVSSVHSLRKFTITQMAKAKVDTEIAKILTGHSIGVRSRYLNYSEEDLLQEYKKAIPFLTISKEQEFKAKTERLEAKNEQIVSMVDSRLVEKDKQIEELTNRLTTLARSMERFQRLVDQGKYPKFIEKMRELERERKEPIDHSKNVVLSFETHRPENCPHCKNDQKHADKLIKGIGKDIIKKTK